MRVGKNRVAAFAIAATAVLLAGCWPWHKGESQQQKFMDALNRGSGAEASQIWLGMDAQSRAAFARNEGMQPNTAPDEVKQQIIKHYMSQASGEESGETVEVPTPNVHLGGLESLPEYVGPSGAPPQAVTVPPKTPTTN